MNTKHRNNLKGVALAMIVAVGTGVIRLVDGLRGGLQNVSRVLAANVATAKAAADAAHEEAVDDGVLDGAVKTK